jgi:hypothetical protein
MSDHVDMFILITGIAAVSAFGALATRYGAETRPGFDERPEPAMHRFIP